MRRKNLTPDQVVERAVKRFENEPGPLLSNDLEHLISPKIREVIGWKYDHEHLFRVRIERVDRFLWRYRLETHLLTVLHDYEKNRREEEPATEWEKDFRLNSCSNWDYSFSWPAISRKRAVEAAHAKLDEIQKTYECRPENLPPGALLTERKNICANCQQEFR